LGFIKRFFIGYGMGWYNLLKPMKKVFNKPLRILLLTNSLVLMAGYMLAPIYALFVEEIGGGLLEASFTVAAFAVAAAITNLVVGGLVDKIKQDELVVATGYLVMGGGFIGLPLVSNLWQLVMVQAVIGFAEALYSPAFDALYTTHTSRRKVGREWGAWEAMNNVMIAIGAVTGGIVATVFGFKVLFVLMGLLALISALYIFRLKRAVL